MQRNLEVLLQIQSLEGRAREIEAEIAALPRRISAIEAKLAGTQQKLERARAAQSTSQSERRQVERDIETLREKISKIRGHSSQVKTNQEYKALTDEIAFAEAQIGKHEERLLEIMEQADELVRDLKAAEAALADERKDVDRETAAASERSSVDRAELDQLAGERTRLRAEVSGLGGDEWLQRFDRVMRSRGQALAAVDREACSGCRVRLRPHFLQELALHPERLFSCESCGRILYLVEDAVRA